MNTFSMNLIKSIEFQSVCIHFWSNMIIGQNTNLKINWTIIIMAGRVYLQGSVLNIYLSSV